MLRTSYLYEFLALMATTYTEHLDETQKKKPLDYSPDVYVHAAQEYIHENYQKARVSDVADYIGISRYYLSHLFNEKLKLSPKDYIFEFRMDKSKELLRTTGESIAQISEKIGYEEPLTYSKAFKKRYGITPKQYRDKHHSEISFT